LKNPFSRQSSLQRRRNFFERGNKSSLAAGREL
jgi:hypothetical protein